MGFGFFWIYTPQPLPWVSETAHHITPLSAKSSFQKKPQLKGWKKRSS
jgi:hypothetical protein